MKGTGAGDCLTKNTYTGLLGAVTKVNPFVVFYKLRKIIRIIIIFHSLHFHSLELDHYIFLGMMSFMVLRAF